MRVKAFSMCALVVALVAFVRRARRSPTRRREVRRVDDAEQAGVPARSRRSRRTDRSGTRRSARAPSAASIRPPSSSRSSRCRRRTPDRTACSPTRTATSGTRATPPGSSARSTRRPARSPSTRCRTRRRGTRTRSRFFATAGCSSPCRRGNFVGTLDPKAPGGNIKLVEVADRELAAVRRAPRLEGRAVLRRVQLEQDRQHRSEDAGHHASSRCRTKDARPRRIAIGKDDTVWYGDYARGFLGHLDPKTGKVEEFQSPGGAESKPYAIDVTRRRRRLVRRDRRRCEEHAGAVQSRDEEVPDLADPERRRHGPQHGHRQERQPLARRERRRQDRAGHDHGWKGHAVGQDERESGTAEIRRRNQSSA